MNGIKFVETNSGGRVALSEVVQIREYVRRSTEVRTTTVTLRDGTTWETWYPADRIADMGATFIQAFPGFTMMRGYFEDGVFGVWRDPVIAWRIEWYGVTPVGIDCSPIDSSGYSIKYPDGQVLRPEDQNYPNEEEWAKDERIRVKAENDRLLAKKEEQSAEERR